MNKSEINEISMEDTIFLIGSGPSLNKIDMSLLKDVNTMSLNRQYIAYEEWGFFPTYYTIIDRKLVKAIFMKDLCPLLIENPKCTIEKYFVLQPPLDAADVPRDMLAMSYSRNKSNKSFDITEEFIQGEDSPRWYSHEDVLIISEGKNCDVRISDYNIEKLISSPKVCSTLENFSDSPLYFCGNGGAFATTLCAYLGFKRVVLLGIDAFYSGRDCSVKAGIDLEHFHPQYFDPETFPEGETQGSPDESNGIEPWKKLSEMQPDASYQILSCTPDSIINDYLDYVNLEDLLGSYA